MKKIAIVTGASGIGLAITKNSVATKIHTIIIGRNEKKLAGGQFNWMLALKP